MLLGLDFVEANGVSLHLKEKEQQIAGDVIPMSLGTGSPLVNEKETGVFLVKGCKVPPYSVMRVGAQLSESMAGECIVKAATKGEILIPRIDSNTRGRREGSSVRESYLDSGATKIQHHSKGIINNY